MKLEDLTGREFGRLTVLHRDTSQPKRTIWICRCRCGREVPVYASNLRRPTHTSSCGCFRREATTLRMTTHGKRGSKVYAVYCAMIQRCCNKNNKQYPDYGGRGVFVCEQWQGEKGFETFLRDMKEPEPGLTLERRENNKGYSPENCYWTTRKAQNRNKRNNVFIEIGGEKRLLVALVEESGLGEATVRRRIKMGWAVEDLFKPVGFTKKGKK